MYKHILIPTDGSELCEKAVKHGVALARAHGARLTALHVTSPFHISSVAPIARASEMAEEHKRRSEIVAEQHLKYVSEVAGSAGVPCETVHAIDSHPYRAIIETARARGCDLITMASHGRRGVVAVALGSETVKVLTHTTIPVLVLR